MPMENLYPLLIDGGAIVGLTALLGSLVPAGYGKYVKPWIAMVLGVLTSCYSQIVAGIPLDPVCVGQGIILGGTVTGLYKVVKGR